MVDEPSPMVRVSRKQPCPVCGKPDWCLVAPDGSAAICPRVSEGSVKRCGDAGYLHILRREPRRWEPHGARCLRLGAEGGRADLGPTAAEYSASMDPCELRRLADQLHLTVKSLTRLRIGWAQQHRAWTFPMRDAELRVRGIRLRSWAGRKWSVTGSRQGLFIPTGLDSAGVLLICEGATDTAALLDLGFEALGRPSCTGGTKLLVELVGRRKPPAVVVVADRDEPGRRGAEALAAGLLPVCRSVRVIYPPEGVKDARAWKRAGAAHRDVQAVINTIPERSVRVRRRAKR